MQNTVQPSQPGSTMAPAEMEAPPPGPPPAYSEFSNQGPTTLDPAHSAVPRQDPSALSPDHATQSHEHSHGHTRQRSSSTHSRASTASDSSGYSSSSSSSSRSSGSSNRRSKKSKKKSRSFVRTINSLTGIPSPSGPPDLSRPIAIPATSKNLGSPFMRAYSPNLGNYNISEELFLKFLDDLNRVATAYPPLRVLAFTGKILQFVPVHNIGLIGAGVEIGAKLTTAAVSKGRTELALRDANRTIFAPRGLKVQIARVDAVAKIAGMPILNDKDKISKETKVMPKVDLSALREQGEARNLNAQQRRLDALSEYIAPLKVVDLPSSSVPNNPISKWESHAMEGDRRKETKKANKQAMKADRKRDKNENRAERRLEKREAKHERKLEKVISEHGEGSAKHRQLESKIERKQGKMESRYAKDVEKSERRLKKDSKEEKAMKKILWLIVRKIEDGERDGEDREDDQDDFTGPNELEGDRELQQEVQSQQQQQQQVQEVTGKMGQLKQ